MTHSPSVPVPRPAFRPLSVGSSAFRLLPVKSVALGSTLFLLPVFAGTISAQEPRRAAPSPWEQSIVTVEVARKQYDFYQPWSKRTARLLKVGLVLPDHQILTTAEELFDRTLIRLQRGGRGRWWIGELAWIDYHANLAVLSVPEEDFWRGLKPAALGGAMPGDGTLQLLRWRNGNLESRRAEFTQFAVREGQLAAVSHVMLEADSDIQGAGWGEPLLANSHVIAVVNSQEGRTCTAITASFIQSILQAHKQGQYRGLGYFHFFWQPAVNPASLARLKVPGEPRGVIVIQVPDRPDAQLQVLKPQDVILQIDGFDLDIQGDYEDPEFGHLMLENLATRNKWAGDEVKMLIWRDGKQMQLSYRLPKYDYSTGLVPMATYDQEPEYLIIGGLVFQPLTDPYLQSWGPDWKRRAPFRLTYYRNDQPKKDRPGLVLLSQVLPDPYNVGYQELKCLVIDKVNGQPVSRLADVRQALKKPIDGFHVIDFVQSDTLKRLVLAAGDPERDATGRVLKRYGISESFQFAAKDK